MRKSILCATLVAALLLGVWSFPAAAAETHSITFPVIGPVHYGNDFGDCRGGCSRGHQGNDIIGARMMPLVAAFDGTVTDVRDNSPGTMGNMITITADDGWSAIYMHVNNDTPGTDDNRNPREHVFAPGIAEGVRVTAGQVVAFMGDSGNAEGATPHLHFELHRPGGGAVNPYPSLRNAQAQQAGGKCALPSNPTPAPNAEANRGYWAVDASGAVYAWGGAPYLGGLNRLPGHTPIVDLAATPTGAGYWIVDAVGAVATYGDAVNYGSLATVRLNSPVVGITPTSTGLGYWLFTRDGGVFNFGDAAFHGSTGALPLNAPIVAMAATTGDGYWLVGADGGVFGFGDAQFYGSTAATGLTTPVVGIAPTSNGYWLVSVDGAVFTFGDAQFYGSIPGFGDCLPPAAGTIVPSETSGGYWVLTTDGRALPFGDAAHYGDPGSIGVRPVGLAAVPAL